MTIDLDPPLSYIPSQIVERGVIALLNLLNKYAIKATFFVPSVVTEKFPTIMEQLVKQKHEIGCHGLKHDPQEMTASLDKQIRIVRNATEIIQSITGTRPVGFRAPLFKTNENSWRALQKSGYIYDSSVVCSPFYGDHTRIFPTKPFLLPTGVAHRNYGLLEIPVSVNPFLPFPLGGAWLRLFGSEWCKIGVKLNFVSQMPVVFYIHPKDVIPRTFGRTWLSYRNTANCLEMLDDVIKYVKGSGAKFLRAYDLARLYEAGFLNDY